MTDISQGLYIGRTDQYVRDYRLLEPLGHGAMGTVWRARRRATATDVALKLMLPELARDSRFVRRFGQEVEILQRLSGRYTARLLEAGFEGGIPYLVTELLDGQSLDSPLPQPLGPDEIDALALGIALGLRDLHPEVVHRDIKPSNIVYTGHGPRLIDFGVARLPADRTHSEMGSAPYMAPEAWTGEAVPASDVWSWACTVVEVATGVRLFAGTEVLAIGRRVEAGDREPYPADRLSPLLYQLLERALDLDPARRPDASEIVHLLTRGRAPTIQWPFRDAQPGPESTLLQAVPPSASSSLVTGHHETFRCDTEGRLLHAWTWQTGGPESAEMPTPGPVIWLAAGSHTDRHQELLAITRDGALFHRWNWAEGNDGSAISNWGDWRAMEGLPPLERVAVLSTRQRYLGFLVLDTSGRLMFASWDEEHQHWEHWQDLSAPARVVAVAAGSYFHGHREIFVVLADGRLLHCWRFRGQAWSEWCEWSYFPRTPRLVEVAVTSAGHGHLLLAGLTAEGELWATDNWSDLWWQPFRLVGTVGTTAGEASLGTRTAASVSAVSPTPAVSTITVFDGTRLGSAELVALRRRRHTQDDTSDLDGPFLWER